MSTTMKAVSRIALQKSDWNEKKREFNKKQLFPASVDFHLGDIKKGIIKNSLTILNDPYQLQKWRRAEERLILHLKFCKPLVSLSFKNQLVLVCTPRLYLVLALFSILK